jgi:alcohol dehydrogenase/propanol-preferring alcohol dehydrogenase
LALISLSTVARRCGRPAGPIAQGQKILGATHNGPSYLQEALALVASGAVTPMVESFPASQVAAAIEKVGAGRVRFKAVVTY